MSFHELPVHAMDSDGLEQWRQWASEANGLEVLHAFLCRLNHLNRSSLPDLEPIQSLLVNRLREQLAPAQAVPESEAV